MKEDENTIAANITDASSNDSNESNNKTNKTNKQNDKQMIGGCCVCADDSGYCDNPLVYCDGSGCNVAVHQACYGIVTVPEGPWFCKRCELNDKNCYCVLCPSKEGAMKRTDSGGWAHVICALYIPEITFTNVRTMEPIVINNIRSERYNKKCYICETNKREENSDNGVSVNCSKTGCKLWFHVTCAQTSGLLCEDHSLPGNNVKYCIYCKNHHSKLNSEYIKRVPPFKIAKNSTIRVKNKLISSNSITGVGGVGGTNSNKKAIKGRIKSLLDDDEKKLNKKRDQNNGLLLSSSSPSSSTSSSSLNNKNKTSKSGGGDIYDDDSLMGIIVQKHLPPPPPPPPETVNIEVIENKEEKILEFKIEQQEKEKEEEEEINVDVDNILIDSKINNLLLKPPESTTTTTTTTIDENKELTAHLLADLSLNKKIEVDQLKSENPTISNNDDEPTTTLAVIPKKSKKNISSLLEPPPPKKLTNKISSLVQNPPPPSTVLSSGGVESENEKTIKIKKQKIKRKSNEDSSKSPSSSPSSKLNIKKRKHHPSNDLVDIFGNRLSSVDCLPAGCSNDFEMLEQHENEKSSKPSTISSILNKKSSLLVGPSKPVVNSQYKILEEEQSNANESIQNQFPETLEDLLLKRWQLDSEFIMEQSQHFDIASLLNCLYQLKNENKDLETKAIELSKKRDQLLLINTRLTVPLEIRASLPNDNNQTTFHTQTTPPTTTITNENRQQQQQQQITPIKTNNIGGDIGPTTTTTSSFNFINEDNKSSLLLNHQQQQQQYLQQQQQQYLFSKNNNNNNTNCNSPSSSSSSSINKNKIINNSNDTKTPKQQKLNKKQPQQQQLQLLTTQNQLLNANPNNIKINEYLANINKTVFPFVGNELYSQLTQQQQQSHNLFNSNSTPSPSTSSSSTTTTTITSSVPQLSTPILLSSLGNQQQQQIKNYNQSKANASTPPQTSNRSTPTPTSSQQHFEYNDINTLKSINPQIAAYLEYNKQQMSNNEQESRKFDKINQLLVSSNNNANNHLQQHQQQQEYHSQQQYSREIKPNYNDIQALHAAAGKSSLSNLMLKQTQQQQQQNYIYQQQGPPTTTSSTSSSLVSLITSAPPQPNTTSSTTASNATNNSSQVNVSNEMFYHTPNQNILLPLNYQIQNLLQNFDPSTAHSILNSLGNSLGSSSSHVDLINLIPHFASQQFQQQQQQQSSSQQQQSSSHQQQQSSSQQHSTTTNDTIN